jgi:hypothetical protein
MDITEAHEKTLALTKADLRMVIDAESSLDVVNIKGICRAAMAEIERLEQNQCDCRDSSGRKVEQWT